MSSITSTQIANLALGRCYQEPISSLTANERNAHIANRHYDNARRFCLKLGEWSFANKRAALTKLSDAPAFGWTYAYALPTDFLTVKRVLETSGQVDVDYVVEGDTLLCNEDGAKLVYTADVEAGVYGNSPEFVEFIFMKLASLMIPEFSVSESVTESVLKKYQEIEEKYVTYDDESDIEPIQQESGWVSEWSS